MSRFLKKHKSEIILSVVLAVLSGVLAWYLSCFLHFLIKIHKVIPATLFSRYSKLYGFPSQLFKILLIIFLTVSFFEVVKYIKRNSSYDKERDFKYSSSGIYGTAKMLQEKEFTDLAQIQEIHEARGNIVGQIDDKGKEVINMRDQMRINKHNLIFGASQSGKTFCFVLPNILQSIRRRESIIVTDPKGELYTTTSTYAKEQGYVVRCFNLKNPLESDGWDCIKEVVNSKDVTPEDRAAIFANIVIQNTQAVGMSKGDIYEKGPELLLKALLLRVALDPELIANNENHISTVVDYVKNPAGSEFLENTVFNPENVPDEAKTCLTTYNSFKQASPNLYGNLTTGLSSRLGPFDSPSSKQLMSTDDIDLTLPGKQPCAYYVIMSDMHETLNFLGALFFSFLFLDLAEYADSTPSKRCDVPVNFILDEFANIGSIPGFDQKMAVIRSRALNVSIILQDINQLRKRYRDTYLSIMSNCATHICIGFNDPDTEEYYSKRAGNITTEVRTDQHEKEEGLFSASGRHSTGTGRRNLLDADELARLGPNELLLCFQGKNVLKANKFPVSIHPEVSHLKMSDEERAKIPPYPKITDIEARRKLREEEERYIKEFNEKLANGYNPIPTMWKPKNNEDIKKKIVDGIKSIASKLKSCVISKRNANNEDIFEIDDIEDTIHIERKTENKDYDESEVLNKPQSALEDNSDDISETRDIKSTPPISNETQEKASETPFGFVDNPYLNIMDFGADAQTGGKGTIQILADDDEDNE